MRITAKTDEMNGTRVLLHTARWLLRLLLVLLGAMTVLAGIMLGNAFGITLVIAGVMLPCTELLFKIFDRVEKRIP